MTPDLRPELVCPACTGPKSKQAKRCAKCSGEGHTPEQRSQHALCGAKKRDGSLCRAFAGQGTDHSGIGVCKFHGGNTTAHRQRAVAIEATRRMVKFGQPVRDAQPTSVLLAELAATAGAVEWLRAEVGALQDLGTHEASVLVRLLAEERDRSVRVAEACIRSGVAEAQVRVLESQVIQTVVAIRHAAQAIGLSNSQIQALGAALREQLAAPSPAPVTLPAA
jgi:hypothetical protein